MDVNATDRAEQQGSGHDRLKTLLLDYYHCTFFLPLLGFGEGVPEPVEALRKVYPHDRELEDEDAQAFNYFTPTLRDIVFDRGRDGSPLEPVREWALSGKTLERWRLELQPSPKQQEAMRGSADLAVFFQQEAVFRSVRLYRYFNGIYLLAFTVEPAALRDLRGKEEKNVSLFANPANASVPQFWHEVAVDDANRSLYEKLQLEAWLRFTRLARQLYPTFTEQGDEDKIAPLVLKTPAKDVFALFEKVPRQLPGQAEHLSPIILHLLQAFFPEPVIEKLKEQVRLFDDRMFVSVAYGLAGKKHEGDLFRIRSLLATTDRFDDTWEDGDMKGYAYAKESMERYLKDSEFDFWTGKGGYYIYNDMVNAYLYNGSFFRDVIAPRHVVYTYDRMLVQALFYQASLRHYDDAITRSTSGLLGSSQKNAIGMIRQQRTEFMRFTNQYWFREVTNQMQGKEIFRLQQRGLGLDEYYRQIQDEITHTNEYLQALHDSRVASDSSRIGKVAALLAVVAALPVFNDIFKAETSLWGHLVKWLTHFGVSDCGARVGIAALLVFVIIGLLWYFLRSKD